MTLKIQLHTICVFFFHFANFKKSRTQSIAVPIESGKDGGLGIVGGLKFLENPVNVEAGINGVASKCPFPHELLMGFKSRFNLNKMRHLSGYIKRDRITDSKLVNECLE